MTDPASPLALRWSRLARLAVGAAVVVAAVAGGLRLVAAYAGLFRPRPAPLPAAAPDDPPFALPPGEWQATADGLSVTTTRLTAAALDAALAAPAELPPGLPPPGAAERQLVAGLAGPRTWRDADTAGRIVLTPDGARLVRVEVGWAVGPDAWALLRVAPTASTVGAAAGGLLPGPCGVPVGRRVAADGAVVAELFAEAPSPADLTRAWAAAGWEVQPRPGGVLRCARGAAARVAYRFPADAPAGCLLVTVAPPSSGVAP